MDTNSRRTRVLPVLRWLRDNGGIEWPTQLLALASGLARQIDPGPFQSMAIDSERLVYPSAGRLLWMLRNAESLAPHDGSRFQEFQRRVVHNPNRAKAIAQLQAGNTTGLPRGLCLEGPSHADCLIECERAVIWIEGKRLDWLSPSITWDAARDHPLLRPATSQLVRDRMARTGRHINPDLRLWTDQEDNSLGTARDEEIAHRLNRSQSAVRARRNILGIPAWNATYSRPWTPDEEALLGVVPDRDLAKRLKRTFVAVQARREIKHLRPTSPLRRRFTPQEDALLKTMSNQQAARKLRWTAQAVAARRRRLSLNPAH